MTDPESDTDNESETEPADDQEATCQYIGTDSMGIDAEIDRGGATGCSAPADVIIRPATNSLADIASPLGKVHVCREHGRWLESDETERQWEQCGEVR